MAEDLALEEFQPGTTLAAPEDGTPEKTAHDLATVFDVPVNISAVLGKAHMTVAQLLKPDRRPHVGFRGEERCACWSWDACPDNSPRR